MRMIANLEKQDTSLLTEGGRYPSYKSVELLAGSDSGNDEEDKDTRVREDMSRSVSSGRSSACCRLSPGCYVGISSCMAALGGVIFGYDTGIVSGALLQLQDEFHLTCHQQELIVSSLLIGALVASVIGGFIIDRCGRRRTIIGNSAIFVSGALILAFAQSLELLIFGRFVLGFAVSLSAIAECVYISEISPTNRRGLLVSLNEFGITLGLLLAYLINFTFISVSDGWRFMFGLSGIPALIQGLSMIFLPSSPRFLLSKGLENEARMVLQILRGPEGVEEELKAIQLSLNQEKSHSFTDLCGGRDNMRARFLIACGLAVLQQVSGQPSVLYYAPIIFKACGFFGNNAATLATVALGFVKMLSTGLTLLCIDKAGRRTFFLSGTFLMTVSIGVMGSVTLTWPSYEVTDQCSAPQLNGSSISVRDIQQSVSSSFQSKTNVDNFDEGYDMQYDITKPDADYNYGQTITNVPASQKWIVLVSLMLYVVGYALSFGPGTWLILSEIFPSSLRGRAASSATVFNWAANLLISATLLELIGLVGIAGTFLSYSSVCAVSVVFIFFFVPETKDQSLEQVSAALKESIIQGSCKSSCCHCKMNEEPRRYNHLTIEDEDV